MPKRLAPLFLLATYAVVGAGVIALSHALILQPKLFQQGRLGWWETGLSLLAVVVFFFVLLRKIRARLFWEVIFGVAVYFGVWFVSLILLPLGPATVLAVVLTVLPYMVPRVALHNALWMIGVCGVSVNFAAALDPRSQIVLLAGLTIYDMVVARPDGPLIHIVKDLLKKRVVPGLLIPATWRGWWKRLDAPFESHAAMLGSGDLILPLMLVARVGFSSSLLAAMVLLGTLSGVWVLVRDPNQHPRAALPWLAVGTVVPFLLLYVLGFFL